MVVEFFFQKTFVTCDQKKNVFVHFLRLSKVDALKILPQRFKWCFNATVHIF